MADIAGGHRVGRIRAVAGEARVVRRRAGRDRETRSALVRLVTGRARDTGVTRMNELAAEGLQVREAFHRARLGVRMTDRADRTAAIAKLQLMAADTRRVTVPTREADTRRICIAPMAQQARHSRVIGVRVGEMGVVLVLGSRDILLWLSCIWEHGAVDAAAPRIAIKRAYQKTQQNGES